MGFNSGFKGLILWHHLYWNCWAISLKMFSIFYWYAMYLLLVLFCSDRIPQHFSSQHLNLKFWNLLSCHRLQKPAIYCLDYKPYIGVREDAHFHGDPCCDFRPSHKYKWSQLILRRKGYVVR